MKEKLSLQLSSQSGTDELCSLTYVSWKSTMGSGAAMSRVGATLCLFQKQLTQIRGSKTVTTADKLAKFVRGLYI